MPSTTESIPKEQQLARRWFRIAVACSITLMLMGVAALAAWHWNIGLFKREATGGPLIEPVSAVLFMLIAAGLFLSGLRHKPKWCVWAIRVLAGAVVISGVLRVFACVTPWDTGVERWLLPWAKAFPIGAESAVQFAMVGVLLGLLTVRLGRWDALLCIPLFGIAVAPGLVVLGHLNGVGGLTGASSMAAMSFPAAVAFLTVVAGLVCADWGLYWSRRSTAESEQPGKGRTSDPTERKVTVGFAAALVMLTLVSVGAYKSLRQFLDDTKADDRARDNLTCIANVTSALTEAEASARGLVLSGDGEYSKRYIGAVRIIGPRIAELRAVTAENRIQQNHLASLSPLIVRRLQTLRNAIALNHDAAGREQAGLATTSAEGREETDAILRELDAMAIEERRLLAARSASVGASARITIVILAVGGGLGIVFVSLAGWMILRDIASRRVGEEELAEAKRVAEAASRTKSEFLAHMSHEIRTPLNGVMGMTDLLLGTTLDDRQRRYCGLAKSSARSLMSVINDILDFSKVEAGKLEIVRDEFNLHSAVGDVIDVLAPAVSRKGLELACHIAPGVPAHVSGDRERLRQILINLINNAVKFTPRGGVVVRLTNDKLEQDNAVVRFCITDTGIGIPADRIDRLFKAFSQADASTTREYGGTGLGLAITKQLAELLGGTVGVESVEGKGSTFWFTAAFGLQEEAHHMESRRREDIWSSASSTKKDPRSLRVLVVDDQALLRDVLVEQIESCGLAAGSASSPEEAIEALEAEAAGSTPYSVAILDMDVHGINGAELVRTIRSRPALQDTLLMAMLSVDSPIDPSQTSAMGFAGNITKPVRQSDLFGTIMNVVASTKPDMPQVAPDEPKAIVEFFPDKADSGSAARILLADDNEVNRVVTTEILRKAGYRYEAVTNGADAVQAVQNGKFDLVLMDCQMPIMDGFEATHAIREWEKNLPGGAAWPMPIIALTANALKGDRERCLAAGMSGYASKPIDPPLLLSTISSLLHPTASTNSSDQSPSAAPSIQPASDTTSEPFDAARLLDFCMGDAQLALKALAAFEEQTLETIRALSLAVGAGDAPDMARRSHALKGTAGTLAATHLSEAAVRLEAAAKAGELSDVNDLLKTLTDEFDRCIAHLPTLRDRLASEKPAPTQV